MYCRPIIDVVNDYGGDPLCESVANAFKMLDRSVWKDAPGTPEEFFHAFVYEFHKKKKKFDNSSFKKYLQNFTNDIKGFIKKEREIDESLDEGKIYDILKGTFKVVTWPIRKLAQIIMRTFFATFKHPWGRAGWMIGVLAVGWDVVAALLSSFLPGVLPYAAVAGIVYWIVIEFASGLSKLDIFGGDDVAFLSTEKPPVAATSFLNFFSQKSSTFRNSSGRNYTKLMKTGRRSWTRVPI